MAPTAAGTPRWVLELTQRAARCRYRQQVSHHLAWYGARAAQRRARARQKIELAACKTLAILDFSALAHRSRPNRTVPSFLENLATHAWRRTRQTRLIQLSYKEAIATVIATRGTSPVSGASQRTSALNTVAPASHLRAGAAKGSLSGTNSAHSKAEPPARGPGTRTDPAPERRRSASTINHRSCTQAP